MTYATLMVQLEVGQPNTEVLQVTGDLAKRFQSTVIGIALCQPTPVYRGFYFSEELTKEDYEKLEKEIKVAEAQFRTALHTRADQLEWHSAIGIGASADYLAHEARSADLLITSADRKSAPGSTRKIKSSDLVMQVGRPVLIVPTTATKPLKFDRALIGWKDTRETRRAVLDALPLLKEIARVTVVEIVDEDDLAAARLRLKKVVSWLKRHRIVAESSASRSMGNDAEQLQTIAREQDADLIVAGAYGHSRLSEWVLGSVTDHLLLRSDRCALLSH